MFDLHVSGFNRFSAMHAFKAHERGLAVPSEVATSLEVSR